MSDHPFFERRTGLFGHRFAEHVWLWDRWWGKLLIVWPALGIVGFLLYCGVMDMRHRAASEGRFMELCGAEHTVEACEQAFSAHHQLCYNVSEKRERRELFGVLDQGRYDVCMQRRMAGLSPMEPRARAE